MNTPSNFNAEKNVSEEAIIVKNQSVHSVSSDIRHVGRSISTFKGSEKNNRSLSYDKYFVGRSYQLFKRGIKAAATLEFYDRNLYYFCEFTKKTTEQLVEEYGPYRKVKGKNRPNVDGIMELQKHIENYVLSLQERVDREEIKPSTCVARMPAIKLFAEMNDIILNWRKIGKLLPRTDLVAEDEAYSREQIKKMLGFCDLRTRIIILLLASSGMRLGGIAGLKHGDLNPLYDKEDHARVIAVHVKVYAGTEDEYDTFCSPEAWHSYCEYIYVREKYGETITKNSPVLLSRFAKKTLAEGKAKPINDATIQNLLSAIRHKAGLDKPSQHYNGRYTIKAAHSFRKFWNSTVRSLKTKEGSPAVSFVNKERMLGHTLVNEYALEDNYDRSDRVKELLQDYLKALPELTISDEARLQVQVKKLQVDLGNMKSVEIELALKDRRMKELEQQLAKVPEQVEEMVESKIKELFELRKQNPVLENIKPEELAKLRPRRKSTA